MSYGSINSGSTSELTEQQIKDILSLAHPVGSLYISDDDTSPAELFGGTWEQIKDKFILAAGDTYAAGSTGGEAEHTLAARESPSHDHYVGAYGNHGWQFKVTGNVGSKMTVGGYILINNASFKYESITDNGFLGTSYSGGGEPHNNMPPYITKYVWQRLPD